MKDILDLEVRRKIFELIKSNPGIHLSKIASLLGMRVSHVEYHVAFLQKHEMIRHEKVSGLLRFYVSGQIGSSDKRLLFVLRQKSLLEIVLFVLKNGPCQHKDILAEIDLSASTLSYHLKKLVKKGVLRLETRDDMSGYVVVERDALMRVLIRYRPFDLFEGFSDVWKDFVV